MAVALLFAAFVVVTTGVLAQLGSPFVRRDDWRMRAQQTSWMNQELQGTTELVHVARGAARDSLAADGRRYGGHTVLLQRMDLRIGEQRCASVQEGEDHTATAFLWGTAVVPFKTRASLEAPPLMMMRL